MTPIDFHTGPADRSVASSDLDGGFTILDRIKGTDGDDTITGTAGNDNIHGRGGDDLIDGGDGDDRINAGHGRDTVDGGAGNDTIFGGKGADSLSGGAGDDVITATRDFPINATETLDGGDGDDTIYGSWLADSISGGDGRDLIRAGSGADSIDGGAGADTVSYERNSSVVIDLAAGTARLGSATASLLSIENAIGGVQADMISGGGKANVLDGGDGADTLSGAGGDDRLHGGAGADQITGGLGADVLEGGADGDVFIYAHTVESDAAHADTILDLEAGDAIDLSAIDADRTQAKDQAFHLVSGGLTGEAGQLALTYDAGSDTTVLQGDVDGDGTADLVITMSGDQTQFTGFVL